MHKSKQPFVSGVFAPDLVSEDEGKKASLSFFPLFLTFIFRSLASLTLCFICILLFHVQLGPPFCVIT